MNGIRRSRRALVAAGGAAVVALYATCPVQADVGTFVAAKDNTLYEPGVGSLSNGGTFSNGAGDYFFAGLTGQPPSLSIRRALIAFDLSTIPADATINSATLTLRVSRSADNSPTATSLHRALASWGEGTSHAPGQEGEGTFASVGDATWHHRMYNTALWSNPGGDYSPVASATTNVGTSGTFSWSGAQVAADVQSWINDPAGNFGWFILGDETRDRSAKRFDSRQNTTASRRPYLVVNYTLTPGWANDSDGNWSVGSNWTTGVAPNGVGASARLGPVIQQPRAITLDVPVTLGSLKFDSPNAYTIGGTHPLTLDASAGHAAVDVVNGSHAIAAPVVLSDSTSFNVAPAASVLTLSNDLTAASGVTITKTGEGALHARYIRTHALSIDAGTVKVLANGTSAATSVVSSLTIAGGSTPTAQLDLGDNALVIDYSGANSPLAAVRAQVASGYNSAAWNGEGIICSGPGSGITHGMGYAEASDVFSSFPAAFAGQSVDNTSVLMKYTRYGDANLDGQVSLADFNRLAANFGTQSGAVWSMGDFNYDGIINLADFNRLAGNFGLSATGPDVTPEDWANLAAAVPEPAALGMLGFASAGLLARRRRR